MSDTKKVKVKGVDLVCKHCGGGSFNHRMSQLNTSKLTFFNLDWLNASADVYVCDDCGFLHWFLYPEDITSPDDAGMEATCLECGAAIPDEVEKCTQCGWTYCETTDGEGRA